MIIPRNLFCYTTLRCILTWKNMSCKYKKRFALQFGANLFLRENNLWIFLKTHQQNLIFSLYYRGVFFCYGEIKCKQGVKNFKKHPNKAGNFLRIVEGVFSFWFSFYKNILSNDLKGGFRMRKNCSGQFFLLPNRIFDERLSPNEFIVYSFLVRAKNSAGQSFWSVPMIAKSCSMCASTCRKVLHSLESGGYITISKRFIGGEQKSNLYTVNKI